MSARAGAFFELCEVSVGSALFRIPPAAAYGSFAAVKGWIAQDEIFFGPLEGIAIEEKMTG